MPFSKHKKGLNAAISMLLKDVFTSKIRGIREQSEGSKMVCKWYVIDPRFEL